MLTNRNLFIRLSCLVFLTGSFSVSIHAQSIMIISKAFSTFNASPEAMLSVGLLNTGEVRTVELDSRLLDSDGQTLLSVRSAPFQLKTGSSSPVELLIREKDEQYGASEKSSYIRNRKILPSGTYNLCYTILDQFGETMLNESCEELSSEYNSDLLLISPFDGAELDTKFPVLIWHHTDPFELLNSGEFFRIQVAEIPKGQKAESAINDGSPVFMQEHIMNHTVSYPIDALPLEEGKSYAWLVQKVSRGVIVQRTEVWTFSIRKTTPEPDIRYLTLSKKLDAGFFTVKNNKLYFRLDDEYQTAQLKYAILDENNHSMDVTPINESTEAAKSSISFHGYNRYLLNLGDYHLKSDVIYTLKVVTQKNEVYLLKFRNN